MDVSGLLASCRTSNAAQIARVDGSDRIPCRSRQTYLVVRRIVVVDEDRSCPTTDWRLRKGAELTDLEAGGEKAGWRVRMWMLETRRA